MITHFQIRLRCVAFIATTVWITVHSNVRAQNTTLDVAAQAFFTKHCYDCHGSERRHQWETLEGILAAGDVKPGAPEQSNVYKQIVSGKMPPSSVSTVRPSDAELAILAEWIRSLKTVLPPDAKVQPAAVRNPITRKDELKSIQHFLDSKEKPARFRFFSLRTAWNRDVSESQMELRRAALAKTVNSLSWSPDYATLIPVTSALIAIDLESAKWNADKWEVINAEDPYGLVHVSMPTDIELNNAARTVRQLTGTQLPIVDSDWFVTNATRSPMYEAVLGLPDNARDLEEMLGVKASKNIFEGEVKRAGIKGGNSDVSQQNRVVERHLGKFGYYWKSYDFKPRKVSGNITRFPLGPKDRANRFNDFAFEHDGGEIIFELPNHLQGFMLVDGDGKRLLVPPPVSIVFDSNRSGGSPEIINAISCMCCHDQGMKHFTNEIFGDSFGGDVQRQIKRQYIPQAEMDQQLELDSERFRAAVLQAISTLVKSRSLLERKAGQVVEPINLVAFAYQTKKLNRNQFAMEMGIDGQQLTAAIDNGKLSTLGIDPQTQTFSRSFIEERLGFGTRFQQAARILDLGTAFIPNKN